MLGKILTISASSLASTMGAGNESFQFVSLITMIHMNVMSNKFRTPEAAFS